MSDKQFVTDNPNDTAAAIDTMRAYHYYLFVLHHRETEH